jgi:hypothetical protein
MGQVKDDLRTGKDRARDDAQTVKDTARDRAGDTNGTPEQPPAAYRP